MTEHLQVDGVDVMVEGEGDETIVMIHGWPDTWRVWDGQVAEFRQRYRCVRFSLPGFDISKPRRAWSMKETIAIIVNIIRQTSPQRKVTLMLHDWGCFFGYQLYARHPELVSRIIGVDIGDAQSKAHMQSLSLIAKLGMAWYQLTLAASWKLGGGIGDAITRFMLKALSVPSPRQYVSSAMNFPYYIAWSRAYGSYDDQRPFRPLCPMLYLYGTRKPFLFHSASWAQALAAMPGNQVQAFETDHWIMLRQPQEFNRTVLAWLDGAAA